MANTTHENLVQEDYLYRSTAALHADAVEAGDVEAADALRVALGWRAFAVTGSHDPIDGFPLAQAAPDESELEPGAHVAGDPPCVRNGAATVEQVDGLRALIEERFPAFEVGHLEPGELKAGPALATQEGLESAQVTILNAIDASFAKYGERIDAIVAGLSKTETRQAVETTSATEPETPAEAPAEQPSLPSADAAPEGTGEAQAQG